MEKITLHYDKSGFEFAEAMHAEKNALIIKIQNVAKNELGLIIDVDDSITLKDDVFKAVGEKYKKQNLLNLTGEKLVELMQINLKPVFDLLPELANYDAIDKNQKPTKEMFTLTVDDQKELERYNHAMLVIDLINKSRTLTNDTKALSYYLSPFRNILKMNDTFTNFEPLPQFVKA